MATKPLTDEQRAKARERARAQNAKPETKARKALHQNKPENLAKRAAYYRRPEVRQRYLDRQATAEHREYMKKWRASEGGQAVQKDAGLRNSTEGTFNLALWNELVKLQGNACAICRRSFDSLGYRDVHADHCHDELKPRGLLCRNCNHAEGQIKKTGLSPEEFGRRMSAYLADPPASSSKVKRAEPEERISKCI